MGNKSELMKTLKERTEKRLLSNEVEALFEPYKNVVFPLSFSFVSSERFSGSQQDATYNEGYKVICNAENWNVEVAILFAPEDNTLVESYDPGQDLEVNVRFIDYDSLYQQAIFGKLSSELAAPEEEEEAKFPPIPVRPKLRKSSVLTNFEKKQQQKLLDLRDSLVDAMAGVAKDNLRSDADGGDSSAFGMHQADAGSDAYDRDFALNLLSQEQDALHEIEEALKRIDCGTYGICEMSKKKIINARLEAIPFARYTVECQAQIERESGYRGGRRLPDRGISGLMDDDLPIIDQSYPPKDPVKVKNENLFLNETKAHSEIPALQIVSIILVVICITLSIIFLSELRDNSTPSTSSEKQTQEETKETADHTKE